MIQSWSTTTGLKWTLRPVLILYMFLLSIKQAFVDLKLQSKGLYTWKIPVVFFFRAESWPKRIKNMSFDTAPCFNIICLTNGCEKQEMKDILKKMSKESTVASNLQTKFQCKLWHTGQKNLHLANLIKVALFDTGLRTCVLHACSTGFGKADEAVEMNSPGTRQSKRIMEGNFERIIVTADVWRKRNIRAVNVSDHILCLAERRAVTTGFFGLH